MSRNGNLPVGFIVRTALPMVMMMMTTSTMASTSAGEVSCLPCRCYVGTSEHADSDALLVANCSGLAIEDGDYLRLPSDIQYLDMNNNELTVLPWPLLDRLVNLTYVDFGKNDITDLCDGSDGFSLSSSVVYVNLVDNNITSTACLSLFADVRTLRLETDDLADDTLEAISGVRKFYLVTSMELIPERLLHPLKGVVDVGLHVKKAVSLPDELFHSSSMATSLRAIFLRGSRLKITNRNLLMHAEFLSRLHLVLGDVETLPYDLLYEEEHQDRPPNLMNRYQLTEVTIEGVRHLPEKIFAYLLQLTSLRITGLHDVPSDLIAHPWCLETLQLTHGQIESLPTGFFDQQSSIRYLDLSHNKLEMNGSELANLDELERVDLSHNEISSLVSNTFQRSGSSLRFLNLMQNRLCHFPSAVLSAARSLKELHIDLSCVETVDSRLFSGLVNVEKATIRVADVRTLPTNVFEPMVSLHDLKLSDALHSCHGSDSQPFNPSILCSPAAAEALTEKTTTIADTETSAAAAEVTYTVADATLLSTTALSVTERTATTSVGTTTAATTAAAAAATTTTTAVTTAATEAAAAATTTAVTAATSAATTAAAAATTTTAVTAATAAATSTTTATTETLKAAAGEKTAAGVKTVNTTTTATTTITKATTTTTKAGGTTIVSKSKAEAKTAAISVMTSAAAMFPVASTKGATKNRVTAISERTKATKQLTVFGNTGKRTTTKQTAKMRSATVRGPKRTMAITRKREETEITAFSTTGAMWRRRKLPRSDRSNVQSLLKPTEMPARERSTRASWPALKSNVVRRTTTLQFSQFFDVGRTWSATGETSTRAPRPLEPVTPRKGFYWPAMRTTRYVRTSNTPFAVPTTPAGDDRANHSASVSWFVTPTTKPTIKSKARVPSHASVTLNWAVPLGIVFLLFVILVPMAWGYCQLKRRDQRKRSPSSFGLADTSYRAYPNLLNSPVDDYTTAQPVFSRVGYSPPPPPLTNGQSELLTPIGQGFLDDQNSYWNRRTPSVARMAARHNQAWPVRNVESEVDAANYGAVPLPQYDSHQWPSTQYGRPSAYPTTQPIPRVAFNR